MNLLCEDIKDIIYKKKFNLEFNDVVEEINSLIYFYTDDVCEGQNDTDYYFIRNKKDKIIQQLWFCDNCGEFRFEKNKYSRICKCWIKEPNGMDSMLSLNTIFMLRQPEWHIVLDSDDSGDDYDSDDDYDECPFHVDFN